MKRFYFSITSLIILSSVTFVSAQTITTVAGNGVEGYNGDNQAATIAQLKRPAGVICDNSGNVYITDFLNHRIRRVDVNGFITTIVGTGNPSYSGDNSAAVNAQINGPEAPYFDQTGNLYFSDAYNHRIRKVATNNIITTFAGTGALGYNGDNIAATTALLNYPSDGVVVDGAGNVFIADTYNNRVRKVSLNGMITTVAGTGVAGYNGDNVAATAAHLHHPYGLALDTDGNLFIADGSNQRIRKVSTSGVITTIAGNGTAGYNSDGIAATTATLSEPRAVLVDAAGNIFIADAVNNRIRKIDANGIISTICGNGNTTYNGDQIPAIIATINYPNGLAFDRSGNLLIAELGNSRIRKISNAVILPLTFTNFTAQLQNSNGLLQWQTHNEVNTKTFVVEVSLDGRNFSPLDSVAARNTSGNNTYSYLDASLRKGINYYRLKSVDKDGKIYHSNIITLRLEKDMLSLGLAPNPTKGLANVSFSSDTNADYALSILDGQGRTIQQLKGKATEGLNNLTLDLSRLTSGSYLLKMNIANKTIGQTKFIKE